jgi:hypothetical protein
MKNKNVDNFDLAKYLICEEDGVLYDQPCKYGARAISNHCTYCEHKNHISRKCYAYGDIKIAKRCKLFKLNKKFKKIKEKSITNEK